MTPRKRIVSGGYAQNADLLDDLDTSAVGGAVAFVPVTDASGNLVLTGVPQGSGAAQGSLYVNPASITANYTLFTAAAGGVSKFRVDAEGDTTVAGDLVVNGGDITTAAGALVITPAAGSNLNVVLSTSGDFAVNTNHLYVDTSTARVGIGTASPAAKLDVASTDGATIQVTYAGAPVSALTSNAAYYASVGSNVFASRNSSISSDYTYGLIGVAQRSNTSNSSYGIAAISEAVNAAGIMPEVVGLYAEADNSGAGNVNAMSGASILVSNSGAGTVSQQSGLTVNFGNATPVALAQGVNVYALGGAVTEGARLTVHAAAGQTATALIASAGDTGSGTKYAAAFLNGSVGIGTETPSSTLTVVQPTAGHGYVTTNATVNLTGVGTDFTNSLKVGDTITVLGETRTVASITSDTSLTVTVAFTTSLSDWPYIVTGGTRFVVQGNGNVGVGTATPAAKLNVYGPSAGTADLFRVGPATADFSAFSQSGMDFSYNNIAIHNSASASKGSALQITAEDNTLNDLWGQSNFTFSDNAAGTRGWVTGYYGSANHYGAGTLTNLYGSTLETYFNAGTVTNAYGIYNSVLKTVVSTATSNLIGMATIVGDTGSAGDTTNMRGLEVQLQSATSGTISNAAGLYIKSFIRTAGTLTNNYGIYLEDQAGVGTNNWQLYSAGTGKSYLGGDLDIKGVSYTWPGANAAGVLTNNGSGTLTWTAAAVGDITAVGSMTSGDAFADSTATGDWLGLGSGAGRIEFDDQATDEVNILSANVGIGTATPGTKLDIVGTTRISGPSINALSLKSTDAVSDYMGIRWQDNAGSSLWYMGNDWLGTGNHDFRIYDNVNAATSLLFNQAAAGSSYLSFGVAGTGYGGIQYSNSTKRLDLFANTSIRATILGTGEFGIGTSSPSNLLSVGAADYFKVNASGDVTTTFIALNGSSTANGAGTASATLTLAASGGTNFDIGNYILVNSTYAKITNKVGDILTISPALTWGNGAAVTEYHIPEIGGTDTASTLTNRYGRGYFIDGIVSGNGTTYYNENGITTTAATFNISSGSNPINFASNVGLGTTSPITQLHVPGKVPTAAAGSVATNTNPSGLYVQGRYAYVVNYTASTLQIFDISNPAAPVATSAAATDTNPQDVYVQGRYAYVVSNAHTLQIFDISNSAAIPAAVGSVSTGALSFPSAVYVQGRYAYVPNYSTNTLKVIDVADPAAPVVVGSVAIGAGSVAVYVQDRYAYVTNKTDNTLQVIDVSNSTAPVVVGSVATGNNPYGVYIQGRYAYVTNISAPFLLQIFDISNPAAPASVGSVAGVMAYSVYVSGRYAFVASIGSDLLQIFDISNPAAPASVGSVATSNGTNTVFVQGRYAYVISGTTGNTLKIFDVGGAYIQQLEAGSLETGNLSVRNNLKALDAAFTGGVTVGTSLNVSGNLSVANSAAFKTGISIGQNSTAYQLQLSADSAAKPVSNTWTVVSDARAKRNVVDFTDGLAKILAINPVSYELNGLAGMPEGATGIGVIAQDVKDIIPYTVGTYRTKLYPEDAEETELYSFNSSALTFVLINAVKELDTKLEKLSAPAADGQLSLVGGSLDLAGGLIQRIGSLEGLGQKWSIGPDGKLIATEIVIEKITIENRGERRTVGRAVVAAGAAEQEIFNTEMTENSLVIATFENDPGSSWWIAAKKNGSFLLKLATPAAADAAFTYWIIGVENVAEEVAPPASVPDAVAPLIEETVPADASAPLAEEPAPLAEPVSSPEPLLAEPVLAPEVAPEMPLVSVTEEVLSAPESAPATTP
ncbi:MAG: tail fiber domain-containing protein [Patescibacteria group bacterium]